MKGISLSMLKYPASLDWEVTPYCNHNCIHCYNYWRSNREKDNDELFNINVTKEWFMDIAQIIATNKPVSVTITGGEPLSVFWKIDCAIEYLINCGIYVSMNTNLTFMDDRIATRIKNLGIHLFTSIPSAIKENCDIVTGTKGSFELIDRGIRKCIEYDIPLAVNMVVTKVNVADIVVTAKYIKNLGMDYFCCTKAAFPANAKSLLRDKMLSYHEFSQILSKIIEVGHQFDMQIDSAWAYSLCGLEGEQIRQFGFKRRCSAGRFNFAITSKGDIKACNVDTVIYGNIFQCTLAEAIEKMTDWQTDIYLPEECKNCESLYLCGGGCRLEAENTYGYKNHLDTTANVNSINRTIDPPPIIPINKECLYELTKDIVIIEENNCYRISRRSLYEYITKECSAFFNSYNQFTFAEFRDKLCLNEEIAEIEFSEFLDKGFIKISNARR